MEMEMQEMLISSPYKLRRKEGRNGNEYYGVKENTVCDECGMTYPGSEVFKFGKKLCAKMPKKRNVEIYDMKMDLQSSTVRNQHRMRKES